MRNYGSRRKEKELVKRATYTDWTSLCFASEELKDDENFVKELMKINKKVLYLATTRVINIIEKER